LGFTNKFPTSRRWRKIFGATRIKTQAEKEDLGLCAAQISQTGLPNQPKRLGPMKMGQTNFPIYFETDLFPNQLWIYFRCGKLGDYVLDMLPTRISPPLYINERIMTD